MSHDGIEFEVVIELRACENREGGNHLAQEFIHASSGRQAIIQADELANRYNALVRMVVPTGCWNIEGA